MAMIFRSTYLTRPSTWEKALKRKLRSKNNCDSETSTNMAIGDVLEELITHYWWDMIELSVTIAQCFELLSYVNISASDSLCRLL